MSTYEVDAAKRALAQVATATPQLNKSADVDAAVAAATGLVLLGYSVRESAGSAAVATVRIMHGATAAGGTALVLIELAADKGETVWFGPGGIACASGLSLDVIAGTVDVVLYTRADT